jgi:DinB superfamily
MLVRWLEAELNRRYPDRMKMRPADAAGFREAWDALEPLWAQTVSRARGLAAEQLHERVDGEWSFIETLRHLVFATDAWVSRAILGKPSPWHPLDLPHDEMPDVPGVPRDRTARPTLDEVLALRADPHCHCAAGSHRAHRRAAGRAYRTGHGAGLSGIEELRRPALSASRPQRGVVAPALRRTGLRRPRGPRSTQLIQIILMPHHA